MRRGKELLKRPSLILARSRYHLSYRSPTLSVPIARRIKGLMATLRCQGWLHRLTPTTSCKSSETVWRSAELCAQTTRYLPPTQLPSWIAGISTHPRSWTIRSLKSSWMRLLWLRDPCLVLIEMRSSSRYSKLIVTITWTPSDMLAKVVRRCLVPTLHQLSWTHHWRNRASQTFTRPFHSHFWQTSGTISITVQVETAILRKQ